MLVRNFHTTGCFSLAPTLVDSQHCTSLILWENALFEPEVERYATIARDGHSYSLKRLTLELILDVTIFQYTLILYT